MEMEAQVVRSILQQNEFLLRRHLILSSTVLEHLRASGLITDMARRKILLEPSHRQVGALLSYMNHKGLTSLRKFLDVLRNTGHSWLVDLILDTDVTMASATGQTTDDIRYRDKRFEPTFVRPHAQTLALPSRQRTAYGASDFSKPEARKCVTAGMPYLGTSAEYDGMSLGALLKAREPVDPSLAPRGMFNARTLLTNPLTVGQGPPLNLMATVQPGLLAYPRTKEDIPITLYGLNQAFAEQEQKNQHAMSVLRQEETAIRQLMEQNARDQSHVRRKQAAVSDINSRLRDIHVRANEVYEPAPHPNVGKYRLAQLNQIPWSIDQ